MEDKNENSILNEEKELNSINIPYKDKEDYPPRSIIIGQYYYIYKDKNKSGFHIDVNIKLYVIIL